MQVCSSANSAVHSVDAVAEAQRRELEIINGFLHFKRVPVDLRRRTIAHRVDTCSNAEEGAA